MRRTLIFTLAAVSLLLALAASASADRAVAIPFHESFVDVDPCTGLDHEVAIDVTFFVHEHDGRVVARGVRTLSTSSGYAGGGTSSYVLNGNVEVFRLSDTLTNSAGNRIRASAVFVLDLSSGAARVDRFEVTCVRG